MTSPSSPLIGHTPDMDAGPPAHAPKVPLGKDWKPYWDIYCGLEVLQCNPVNVLPQFPAYLCDEIVSVAPPYTALSLLGTRSSPPTGCPAVSRLSLDPYPMDFLQLALPFSPWKMTDPFWLLVYLGFFYPG